MAGFDLSGGIVRAGFAEAVTMPSLSHPTRPERASNEELIQ